MIGKFAFLVFAMAVTAGSNAAAAEVSPAAAPAPAAQAFAVEILNPAALALIEPGARISVRGEGYKWTEGPLWIDDGGYLLFSDIPNNTIVKYQPGQGTSVYLRNSGATGLYPGDYGQGSNGLLLNERGQLVLLQQGDRRVAAMAAPLSAPAANFITLAGDYQGKRLNSPNDGVYHSDGSLYFTDPPYGLDKGLDDQRKELPMQGVYRLSAQGDLVLLDASVTFPNGIALSVDEKTLYVAVSDPQQPVWLAYDIVADGGLANKRIFYDASDLIGVAGEQGVPDGMAVHSSGNIFATGPGGVWLFNPQGEVLAKIRTGKLSANCGLSADEKRLFIAAHDTLLEVPLH